MDARVHRDGLCLASGGNPMNPTGQGPNPQWKRRVDLRWSRRHQGLASACSPCLPCQVARRDLRRWVCVEACMASVSRNPKMVPIVGKHLGVRELGGNVVDETIVLARFFQ